MATILAREETGPLGEGLWGGRRVPRRVDTGNKAGRPSLHDIKFLQRSLSAEEKRSRPGPVARAHSRLRARSRGGCEGSPLC
jgi:hypothetical protein